MALRPREDTQGSSFSNMLEHVGLTREQETEAFARQRANFAESTDGAALDAAALPGWWADP